MKVKSLLPVLGFLIGIQYAFAQQSPTSLNLTEAVKIALKQSDDAKLADIKVMTAEQDLNSLKNLQYPDVKISGQYSYLTSANVKMEAFSSGNSSDSESSGNNSPDVHSLLLGQANVTMPLFMGFKLKHTVNAGKNQYNAAVYNGQNEKEQLTMQVIMSYLNLYKATQTITLIQENLKSAQQRVTDFTAMEENGLLARNDLLKAQLQESNIELALDQAQKNRYILNRHLVVLLKLSNDTQITTDDPNIDGLNLLSDNILRSDLEALKYNEQAALERIGVAKSKYFPSISLVSGYIGLDVQNALTITNAMNFGVGISYNLSDLFKAKSDVKAAESRAQEMQYQVSKATDQITLEIENAEKDYDLALKSYDVYTKSVVQATENYRIVKDKYDNGLEDTNDLLDADVQQLQTQINLAHTKADVSLKYYQLLLAKGQLINTLMN